MKALKCKCRPACGI